jgi:hypothetical protein
MRDKLEVVCEYDYTKTGDSRQASIALWKVIQKGKEVNLEITLDDMEAGVDCGVSTAVYAFDSGKRELIANHWFVKLTK